MSVRIKITPKVDEREFTKLRKRLLRELQKDLEVGVFQKAGSYPDGTPVSEVAIIHEFGAPSANIPERSFLRSTLRDNRTKIVARVEGIARGVVQGKSGGRMLSALGLWISKTIKDKILSGPHIPPPLSPITVKLKGHSRPLVDTERLAHSITFRVVPHDGNE